MNKVFLVLHHEILVRGQSGYLADDVVLHVASSLAKALRYIRQVHVEEYSWWEIQQATLDNYDNPVHAGWYGRRGGKLKQQPFAKAVAAYKRCKADPRHHLNV